MDASLKQLRRNGMGCHVGPVYADAFSYADDAALVSRVLYRLSCMF